MKRAWNRLIGPAQQRFRTQRARRILALFPDLVGARIVDIGGSLPFWQTVGPILRPAEVVIYNISASRMEMGQSVSGATIVMRLYDGDRIPEADGSADFILCNSVIEHVAPERREALAQEIRRVGRRYVVQTPSPSFPLELHFGLPFIHWLPRRIARALVGLSPFALLTDADARAYFDQTRLLPVKEMRRHFPGASILIERFLGIPKSIVAFGPGSGS